MTETRCVLAWAVVAGAQEKGSGGRNRAHRAAFAIVPTDAVYRSHPLTIPRLVPIYGTVPRL